MGSLRGAGVSRRFAPAVLCASSLLLGLVASAGADEPPTFVRRFARLGTAIGFVEFPQGIALDAAGTIYVADTRNHRIQKFDQQGQFVAVWGDSGSAPGQFDHPTRLAVDAAGFVYVADSRNARIQKFALDGGLVAVWDQIGSGRGQFINPFAVAVDPIGNVYVSDTGRGDVQKLSADGAPLRAWGSTMNDDGAFHSALGLTATAAYVYVSEIGYLHEGCCQCVHQFTTDGVFVRRWGRRGELPEQFLTPLGLTTDSLGNVYVVDHHNFRLQKFTADGTFVATWGQRTTAPGDFIGPHDLAIDTSGNLFVTDFKTDDGQVMHFAYRPTAVQPQRWQQVKQRFRPSRGRP